MNQNAEIRLEIEIVPNSTFLSLNTKRRPEAFRKIMKRKVGTQWINVIDNYY